MISLFRGTLHGVERVATTVAGVAILTMMLFITASAVTRHLFGQPIGGIYELTVYYLMPGVVWLGISGTERQQAHIRVRLLLNKLRPNARSIMQTITRVIAAAIVVLIAASSMRGLETHWGQTLGGATPLPVGPSRLLLTLGAILLALRLMVGTKEEERSDLPTGEPEEGL